MNRITKEIKSPVNSSESAEHLARLESWFDAKEFNWKKHTIQYSFSLTVGQWQDFVREQLDSCGNNGYLYGVEKIIEYSSSEFRCVCFSAVTSTYKQKFRIDTFYFMTEDDALAVEFKLSQ